MAPDLRTFAPHAPTIGRASAPPAVRSRRAESAPRGADANVRRPDLSWRRAAACLGHDVSLFFPPDGLGVAAAGTGAALADGLGEDLVDGWVDRAKAVCAGCPVQARCLQHALEHREHHGIWGGTTEAERRRILRRRRRRLASAG